MPPKRWMNPYPSLLPCCDHRLVVGQLRPQLGEEPVEPRERLRHLVRVDAELAQLPLVVERDDVLAGLGDAPDRALPERLAVGRPPEHAPGGRRVEPVPTVLLDVLRERDDQLGLHELSVRLVALVPLGHVRPAARRECARNGADEAVEVLEDDVDLHARVALLEVLAELLQHGLKSRVLVVVGPHRQGDGRCLLAGVRCARGDREQHDGGKDEDSEQAALHSSLPVTRAAALGAADTRL